MFGRFLRFSDDFVVFSSDDTHPPRQQSRKRTLATAKADIVDADITAATNGRSDAHESSWQLTKSTIESTAAGSKLFHDFGGHAAHRHAADDIGGDFSDITSTNATERVSDEHQQHEWAGDAVVHATAVYWGSAGSLDGSRIQHFDVYAIDAAAGSEDHQSTLL
jgi:hypothetical protein